MTPDVAATPPDIILLQNRLSGLSAEILSRHIRNQLPGTEGVTIAVLAESADDAPDETTIATTVSDEDLVAAVRRMITSSAALPASGSPGYEVPDPATTPGAMGSLQPTQSLPAPEGGGSFDDGDVISFGGKSADGTDRNLSVPSPAQALNFSEELDMLTGPQSVEKTGIPAMSPFPASAPVPREHPPRNRRWILLSGVVIALCFGTLTLWRSTTLHSRLQQKVAPQTRATAVGMADISKPVAGSPKTETAPAPGVSAPLPGSSPVASSAARPKRSLPPFIPPQSLVAGYGDKKPGWEQYMTPEYEFRIFRKEGEIAALQVIDRTGKGLSRSFFTRAIKEMADVRDYRLRSKEIQGDYLIKRGILSRNAAVILYKNRDDTHLRAFVIHFS